MGDIKAFFEDGGILSEHLPTYENRAQQIEMAYAVADVFESRKPLIVEAATGTGKTLAYLMPAIASGKRVVVSTQTKALQEQIFSKDIPFLKRVWPGDFSAVVLKGRKNYLCKLRFDKISQPVFRKPGEGKYWARIKSWAEETKTGDRAEIPGLPDDYQTWSDLSVGSEACLGSKCPFHEECFVTKAREDAAKAQIIVVNHHLFFADLALRDLGHGEVLPPYDAIVFDEAHHLESIATSYFGLQISNYRFSEVIGDITRALDEESIEASDLVALLDTLDVVNKNYFSNLKFGKYDGRYLLDEVLDGSAKICESQEELTDLLKDIEHSIGKLARLGERRERLATRVTDLRLEIGFITRQGDDRFVYFLEIRDRGTFLQACPIDVAETVRRKLLDTHDMMVFTSATLSTAGDFEFLKDRLGMLAFETKDQKFKDYDVKTLSLPAVFDYENNCMLYVPNRLPEPRAENYVESATTVIKYLLDISGGDAFVLFTSYANLNAVHENLEDEIEGLVLKQGEAPKSDLLQTFKDTPGSVLFATASFWEGVDVEGEALRLVIIDKLPFSNPSDPVFSARAALLESRKQNPFMDLTVPMAALSLKQGFGRLIRSKSDKGVVAILDSRIATKRYGSYFIDSLPPAKLAWRAAEVRDWWSENMSDESE